MKLKIIVACDFETRGINMVWNIPQDMKHFKKKTTQDETNIVIMGRKTYESIGKPLPNRLNFVISRTMDKCLENPFVFNSFEDCLKYIEKYYSQVIPWVIGGSFLYKYVIDKHIDKVDKIFCTYIYNLDPKLFNIYFPTIDMNLFNKKSGSLIRKRGYEYRFVSFKKL
jgi:dihydrofolate reductase